MGHKVALVLQDVIDEDNLTREFWQISVVRRAQSAAKAIIAAMDGTPLWYFLGDHDGVRHAGLHVVFLNAKDAEQFGWQQWLR